MPASYPFPLRTLHWLMAALIFAALGIGIWAIYLPRGTPLRVELLNLHKSVGVTVLVLIVLRIIVRLASAIPPYRPPLSRLNSLAAHAAHGLLYVVMIAMPLSGYVHSTAGGHGFKWLGLFQTPMLFPRSEQADAGAGKAHYLFAWVIGALLAAHLLAVLWHSLVRRDGVLQRMWPARA